MAKCPVQQEKVLKLLTHDYQNHIHHYETDDYIRKLRKMITNLALRNDFLEQKNNYLPKVLKNDNEILNFSHKEIETVDQLEKNNNYGALTITYDPNYFPQLLITPLWEQENYIKRVLSKFINENRFKSVYGSYELQQNGRIHFHGIIPIYDYNKLDEEIANYFTSYTGTKQKAVKIKPVDDVQGWLDYINKKDKYKKILEYQLRNDYIKYTK